LPLCQELVSQGFVVKGSTRSVERNSLLADNKIQPFNIDLAANNVQADDFLNADILIVNIPFKEVHAFSTLVEQVAASSISKVIFISSTSVYGDKEGLVCEHDENLTSHPLLDIEALFTSNTHFSTTVLRFAGLIGPKRNPALFFKNNRSVKNPDYLVNMIHQQDCVNIISIIIKQQAWGEIYNGCAESHPSKRAFYTHTSTISGVPIPKFDSEIETELESEIKSASATIGNESCTGKVISNHKVKTELGYQFVYPDLLNLNAAALT
jgi:nucleoside-diphosphate-sugar epimerase